MPRERRPRDAPRVLHYWRDAQPDTLLVCEANGIAMIAKFITERSVRAIISRIRKVDPYIARSVRLNLIAGLPRNEIELEIDDLKFRSSLIEFIDRQECRVNQTAQEVANLKAIISAPRIAIEALDTISALAQEAAQGVSHQK